METGLCVKQLNNQNLLCVTGPETPRSKHQLDLFSTHKGSFDLTRQSADVGVLLLDKSLVGAGGVLNGGIAYGNNVTKPFAVLNNQVITAFFLLCWFDVDMSHESEVILSVKKNAGLPNLLCLWPRDWPHLWVSAWQGNPWWSTTILLLRSGLHNSWDKQTHHHGVTNSVGCVICHATMWCSKVHLVRHLYEMQNLTGLMYYLSKLMTQLLFWEFKNLTY